MDIRFDCPRCGQNLAVEKKGARVIVDCPNCKEQIEIPRASTASPPQPPSASVVTTRQIALPTAPELRYWLGREGNVRAPYTFEILLVMWARKELRLTDRLCVQSTESWTEVANVMKSLEEAAHSQSEQSRNPPGLPGIMLLSALLPIIGLIMGIVWLSQPRFRSAGGQVLFIAIVFGFIWFLFLLAWSTG